MFSPSRHRRFHITKIQQCAVCQGKCNDISQLLCDECCSAIRQLKHNKDLKTLIRIGIVYQLFRP
jgi:hypothetical protein